MMTLGQDIRYALRQLRRSPGFAATAILTLALGIGATTAIFSLVYQVILRDLPIAHPEQLYKVGKNINCCVLEGLQDDWSLFSNELYRSLRDQTQGKNGIAAVNSGVIMVGARRVGNAGASAASMPLGAGLVSGNYFSLLGVVPYAGRLLNDTDDRVGAPPTAVLSYTLWKTKFAGDPSLVGQTLMLSGHPVTVVGIAAPKFMGEHNAQDPPGLWLALSQEPMLEPDRKLSQLPGANYLDLLVRIPDPKQVAGVQSALQGELRQWLAANVQYTHNGTPKEIARQTTELAPASSGINDLRAQYETSLRLLFLVAGFVLLIACANLANLMLVRGMARQQQLAVRSALGAPRMRLVRQTLVEAVVLSLLGGAAASAVAYATSHAIIALAMPSVQVNPVSAALSVPVMAFAVILSLFTGLFFGIAPAWITSRANPVEAMRGANRSTRDASATPQKLMVILQSALSLALLSTAGLLATSLRHLEHQDFHFETQGRLLVSLDLPGAGYNYRQVPALYQQFDDVLGHLPGVESVAYASYAPMAYSEWISGVSFPGSGEDAIADYDSVSEHFFGTLGTPVLLGRGFTDQDTATSQHVAVVNQEFVKEYLKGKNPIGEHFGPQPNMMGAFEIVGVVGDTKYGSPSTPVHPMFFMPMTQWTAYTAPDDISQENTMHFASAVIFKYRGDPGTVTASVRRAFKTINPDISIFSIHSYDEQLYRNFTQERLVVRLTALFGVVALVLAALGLYGITAYTVVRRTSEIGIRMALGSSRKNVYALILSGALRQVLVGLCLGVPLALGASSLVRHTLYQTSAFQPVVLLVVAAMLTAAAILASMIPARRAAAIDPMHALRAE